MRKTSDLGPSGRAHLAAAAALLVTLAAAATACTPAYIHRARDLVRGEQYEEAVALLERKQREEPGDREDIAPQLQQARWLAARKHIALAVDPRRADDPWHIVREMEIALRYGALNEPAQRRLQRGRQRIAELDEVMAACAALLEEHRREEIQARLEAAEPEVKHHPDYEQLGGLVRDDGYREELERAMTLVRRRRPEPARAVLEAALGWREGVEARAAMAYLDGLAAAKEGRHRDAYAKLGAAAAWASGLPELAKHTELALARTVRACRKDAARDFQQRTYVGSLRGLARYTECQAFLSATPEYASQHKAEVAERKRVLAAQLRDLVASTCPGEASVSPGLCLWADAMATCTGVEAESSPAQRLQAQIRQEGQLKAVALVVDHGANDSTFASRAQQAFDRSLASDPPHAIRLLGAPDDLGEDQAPDLTIFVRLDDTSAEASTEQSVTGSQYLHHVERRRNHDRDAAIAHFEKARDYCQAVFYVCNTNYLACNIPAQFQCNNQLPQMAGAISRMPEVFLTNHFADYQFVVHTVRATTEASMSYIIWDSRLQRVVAQESFEARDDFEDSCRSGVHPKDSEGYEDTRCSLPDSEELVRGNQDDVIEQALSALRRAMTHTEDLLLARAREATEAGELALAAEQYVQYDTLCDRCAGRSEARAFVRQHLLLEPGCSFLSSAEVVAGSRDAQRQLARWQPAAADSEPALAALTALRGFSAGLIDRQLTESARRRRSRGRPNLHLVFHLGGDAGDGDGSSGGGLTGAALLPHPMANVGAGLDDHIRWLHATTPQPRGGGRRATYTPR